MRLSLFARMFLFARIFTFASFTCQSREALVGRIRKSGLESGDTTTVQIAGHLEAGGTRNSRRVTTAHPRKAGLVLVHPECRKGVEGGRTLRELRSSPSVKGFGRRPDMARDRSRMGRRPKASQGGNRGQKGRCSGRARSMGV